MKLNYLDILESESIFILREVFSQFKNPAILFSGGKDSITLVHLAQIAFWPRPIPFKLVHVDTGHNFKETIRFRDLLVKNLKLDLIVGHVESSIKKRTVIDSTGPYKSRNSAQSITLLELIKEHKFDALIGGARRDEEKARAKERIFSFRGINSQWDIKNQRPEIGLILNGKINSGENMRVFPLSNWTELDVWEYIKKNKIEIPSLYFSHEREIFERENVLYAFEPFMELLPTEKIIKAAVRFRTIGDVTCTGAVLSNAKSVDEVIAEIKVSKTTERGTRADDKTSESSMEERKKQGYF